MNFTAFPTLEKKLALPQVKVDIGCGARNRKQPADEWIHLDGDPSLVDLDILCDFSEIPLESNSVDVINAADCIEHVPLYDLPKVLKEWNRILKIDGILRIQCPNVHSTMIRYANGDLSFQDAIGALYGNQDDKWEQHYTGYTCFTLEDTLSQYGFGFCDFSESPGNDNCLLSWWIVAQCRKVKDI